MHNGTKGKQEWFSTSQSVACSQSTANAQAKTNAYNEQHCVDPETSLTRVGLTSLHLVDLARPGLDQRKTFVSEWN
eukprot:6214352-Amphidinium_carterae.1